MLKLIVAAKSGNLNGLKKLKDDGVNLSKKDEDGNTALLWAACYGHLDVVKWLLNKSDYAKITERNNAGNTALLLAVAYGHFPLVQWLLKEGGGNPPEKNCLGNNSLFLAANHGHLDIFDYLVRYYYLAIVSNLNCSRENKAICYYLKVIEFFSKKPMKIVFLTVFKVFFLRLYPCQPIINQTTSKIVFLKELLLMPKV